MDDAQSMLRWRVEWVKPAETDVASISQNEIRLTMHALRMCAARAVLVALTLASVACAPLPPQSAATSSAAGSSGLTIEQRPSPNFDVRRPSLVVIHHTSDNTAEEALRTLTNPARKVSSHYLISRDGRLFQLVDELSRAWHAGESYWSGSEDVNSASIGIELDNNGREPYAEPMIAALLQLLADLKERFEIPAANFIGHGDVAPGRKVDPGALFPWKRLADEGYGLWCDPPYPAAPPAIDTALLLHAFGYNVTRPDAAAAAFKRRFVPDDASPVITEKDRSILYCLVMKKQTSGAW